MAAQTIRLACDAVLFDLDGVLVDSTAQIEATWREWAGRHGLDAAAILRIVHGRPAIEIIRIVAPHLDAATEKLALTSGDIRASTEVRAASGARGLLEALPVDRWAIVTSGVRIAAEHRLQCCGLPIPRVMVCADEVVNGKPDPEGYLAAARRLGAPPHECVVIEDAPPGIEAACGAGMQTIALTTSHRAEELRNAQVIATGLDAVAVHVSQRGPAPRLALDVRVGLSR
jgi:mannitol-1-/sugar-/sorbitol-6-phosphatase